MSKLLQRLQDARRSGVYRVRRVDEVLDATRGSGLDVVRISLLQKTTAIQSIAAALDFPDWFGGNWDALEDCLSDLSWRAGDGHVLLLEQAPAGDEHGILLDVLGACAESWAARGRPFFAVFVDAPGALALPELFREK
ncbi:MAG TPA: barstar family protein [Burkholderiales bacterium]